MRNKLRNLSRSFISGKRFLAYRFWTASLRPSRKLIRKEVVTSGLKPKTRPSGLFFQKEKQHANRAVQFHRIGALLVSSGNKKPPRSQLAGRRHNEHIECCNRLIEAGQDSEAELQRVRKELADTKAENKSLRNQLATAQKYPAPGKVQGKVESPPPVKEEKESKPGHLVARIQSLQKELREEQRKNQQARGTSR